MHLQHTTHATHTHLAESSPRSSHMRCASLGAAGEWRQRFGVSIHIPLDDGEHAGVLVWVVVDVHHNWHVVVVARIMPYLHSFFSV